MLSAIKSTALRVIEAIQVIKQVLMDNKHRIRYQYKFYSQDLSNNLFTQPYTKIDLIMRDLKVSRLTATQYLDALAIGGFIEKRKVERCSCYINLGLNTILTVENLRDD